MRLDYVLKIWTLFKVSKFTHLEGHMQSLQEIENLILIFDTFVSQLRFRTQNNSDHDSQIFNGQDNIPYDPTIENLATNFYYQMLEIHPKLRKVTLCNVAPSLKL